VKDEWPPRRITVITRIGSRNVINIDEAVDLIRSYGLDVNWIQEMGHLSFQQQVQAMAETGILLAVHGAGLANVMFMPAHSVVVEITPYILYASMYRDLAATAGLYYYRLPSDKPASTDYEQFHDQTFFDKCDGNMSHISSPAAFLDYECNSRSKGCASGGAPRRACCAAKPPAHPPSRTPARPPRSPRAHQHGQAAGDD
jgi:hypothetical protein